jgi:cytoskeletal protein CcmA (bactofilin family)
MIPAAGALVLALGQPPAALAAETRGGNDITVGPSETIDDDLYAFGQNVTILGTVTGSVIAGGNTVAVSGEVGGDLMAAGSTVIVDGPVHGSVRAAGQSVQVRDGIDGDLLAAGNSVSVLGDGRIGRDLLGAATTLTIAGPVGRDVHASGDQVRISSSVGGEVDSNASNLRLDPTARVAGSVRYTSVNEADVASGATIGGAITRSEPASPPTAAPGAFALDLLAGTAGLAVLGLVMLVAFPGTVRRKVQMLRHSPWTSLGVGALVLIVTPLLAAIVFVAGLWAGGWWLSLPLLAAYVVWLFLGYLVSAVAVGRELLARLRRPAGSPVWSLLLGLLVLGVLGLIPFVGGLIGLIAVVFGGGALLMGMRRSTRAPSSVPFQPASARVAGAAGSPSAATP